MMAARRRPAAPLLLAALAIVALSGCRSRAPRLNLLVVTLDTLRADRLGCYGYGRPTTPALDALASRSVVFEQAIAQAAVTPVSHASIFTGLDPQHHGLRALHGGSDFKLPERPWTLAEILREAGYATGGFVSSFPATRRFGLDQGFDAWDQDFAQNEGAELVTASGIVNTGASQRRAGETTDRALAWLGEHRDRPFFAWVHYFDVHDNLIPPPEEYVRRFAPASPDREDVLRGLYDAQLAYMDSQLDRLLGALRAWGIEDRTVVVAVADHGEGLGDHDWWGHVILYQEQVRVPFILHVPGLGPARRVADLVRTIDIAPTLLELMRVPLPDGVTFDGRSLLETIRGGTAAPPPAYSETIGDLVGYYNVPARDASIHALNDGRWKLLAYRRQGRYLGFELYDLAQDPAEQKDLHERHPDEVARLRDALENMAVYVDHPQRPELDEETREKLRSLGYVQ